MRAFLFPVLMLAACGEAPVDMKDPAAVTRRFVNAYNARDLSHMLPLVDQVNLDAVKEALTGGPGSEAYNGIFQPQMTDLLARDGGKIDGPRFDGGDAMFKVGDTVNGDVYTVKLSQSEDGKWLIAEFPTLSEREYLALPETQPKR
ncbi:MAG: hypothetical protein QM773_08590 [Hyphomonadaceae bacterium]